MPEKMPPNLLANKIDTDVEEKKEDRGVVGVCEQEKDEESENADVGPSAQEKKDEESKNADVGHLHRRSKIKKSMLKTVKRSSYTCISST